MAIGLVLVLAVAIGLSAWLFGRQPLRFLEGATLTETILLEHKAWPRKLTWRTYKLKGDVHSIARQAFAELSPKGWKPVPPRFDRYRLWNLDYLLDAVGRSTETYELSPGNPPTGREQTSIYISRHWGGEIAVSVTTPTTWMDRLAHFLGRR